MKRYLFDIGATTFIVASYFWWVGNEKGSSMPEDLVVYVLIAFMLLAGFCLGYTMVEMEDHHDE